MHLVSELLIVDVNVDRNNFAEAEPCVQIAMFRRPSTDCAFGWLRQPKSAMPAHEGIFPLDRHDNETVLLKPWRNLRKAISLMRAPWRLMGRH
jgi:hypothetical protein